MLYNKGRWWNLEDTLGSKLGGRKPVQVQVLLGLLMNMPSWWNGDTLRLGRSAVRRAGSSPVEGTEVNVEVWPNGKALASKPSEPIWVCRFDSCRFRLRRR